MGYEKFGENKMKQFDYLQSILKLPGVRALYVFDKEGREIYRESTFSHDKEYYKDLINYYRENMNKLPHISYFFTDTHLVIIAHHFEVFKGFLMCVSFKETNLGLIRINIRKFLKLD